MIRIYFALIIFCLLPISSASLLCSKLNLALVEELTCSKSISFFFGGKLHPRGNNPFLQLVKNITKSIIIVKYYIRSKTKIIIDFFGSLWKRLLFCKIYNDNYLSSKR